jgi:polysaccharide pyruvyl transferase WcaK-like protein
VERMPKKIALLHHTGCGNLGDDAIIDAVLDNIRRRWRNAEIAVFSMNPDDTAKKHGIASYPIRRYSWTSDNSSAVAQPTHRPKQRFVDWIKSTNNPAIRLPRAVLSEVAFLIDSYRATRHFDLLIVSGGGQLTERGGPWSFPYALFVWSLIARWVGVKWIFLNVGAGPLNHSLSRFFVRRTLNAAEYVSFRDRQSQELARELGFAGRSYVFPDNVYGFHAVPPNVTTVGRTRPLVGFAPMPYPFGDLLKSPADASAVQNDLINRLSAFASLLTKQSYSVEMFGSDTKADPQAIEDVRTRLRSYHHLAMPEYKPLHSVDELLSRMATMDYIVTCRFHGVVLAHLLNKPVLAIAHHPKVTDLMSALGLSKYSLDMRTAEPIQLMEAFSSLVSNAESVKRGMAESLARYRSESAMQFDELFPLILTESGNRLPAHIRV